MGQPAVSALAPPPFELVYDDGKPLETIWHAFQLPLLNELLYQAMAEQDRSDFFASANVFVYYSRQQAREVWEEETQGLEERAFRGPDVFWVGGVDPGRERKVWVAWEEDGRLPDVIFEMLSPSTAKKDRTEKKDLYEKVFRTAEYFLYDPNSRKLEGFRLVQGSYQPIRPDRKRLLGSERLGVSIGLWQGVVNKRKDTWVRLFRADGTLVPTATEQAGAERQRADAAEAELARLRALLEERGRG